MKFLPRRLLPALLLLTTACASAPVDPDDRYHHVRAFTAWNCAHPAPVIFYLDRLPGDALEAQATVAHEESHRATALSFPSCPSYKKWLRVPENQLTFEALAFCAGLRQMVRSGATQKRIKEAVTEASVALAEGYGFRDLTPERARARLLAVCR